VAASADALSVCRGSLSRERAQYDLAQEKIDALQAENLALKRRIVELAQRPTSSGDDRRPAQADKASAYESQAGPFKLVYKDRYGHEWYSYTHPKRGEVRVTYSAASTLCDKAGFKLPTYEQVDMVGLSLGSHVPPRSGRYWTRTPHSEGSDLVWVFSSQFSSDDAIDFTVDKSIGNGESGAANWVLCVGS
jgi:hypothetical protein